jgi:hypothetical protein
MGYASATMKGIVNHMRAIDLLASLPEVDPGRIAAVGHSLGGHNALFLAAFDARVRAVVTSCGFTSFHKYKGGDLAGWSHRGYMPRIASEYGNSPDRMPFDFDDVLEAISPRPVFVNAPLRDDNFDASGVDDAVRAAGGGNTVVVHPDAAHDFPPRVRQQAWAFLDGVRLVGVRRIWDRGEHNAFTDLIRYRGRWFCVFREGKDHVSPDGAVRVLTSPDGESWSSAALLRDPRHDLRDPKLSIAPDGRLMLLAAGVVRDPEPRLHTFVWFSDDGRRWTAPSPAGEPDIWLWRVTWRRGVAYGAGYGRGILRLYRSRDGRRFETIVPVLADSEEPNESSIVFRPDDTAVCLVRRDGARPTAQLGLSRPPYSVWTWKDLGVRIGGPHLLALPGGRILAGVRLYDGGTRTSLCAVDIERGQLRELLALPSGGDTSYPGLVYHRGLVWMSYYSSHEGRTSIYLAKLTSRPD